MKAANVKTIIGEVVDITGEIPSENGKPFILITVKEADGNRNTIITSASQLDKFKLGGRTYSAVLENGFMASLECEDRIKGVTEYVDAEGNTVTHNNSGLALSNILPLASFEKKILEKSAFADFNSKQLSGRVEQLRALGFDNSDIATAIRE